MADGEMYRLIHEAGSPFTFSDFDQNTGILQAENTDEKPLWKFPGNDTKPSDYAELFSFEKQQGSDPTLTDILKYDVIVIKSCYPNSNLKSREELEAAQAAYQSILSFFDVQPTKKLIILTSPPLAPIKTNPQNAARARSLANWLSSNTLAENVFVFDLFDLLAAEPDEKQGNTLKKSYRRWLPLDSHPNKRASQDIAPKLVDFLSSLNS